jgi:Rieske Fe-S protein
MAPTRRQFLDLVAGALAAGLAATLEGCEDTLRTSFTRAVMPVGAGGPLKVAPLSALTTTPTAFPLVTADGGEAVHAYLEDGKPVVISTLCTHRGCTVKWDAGQSLFACPCHAGYFDIQGKVVSGPPLAPLTRYTVSNVGDDVYIQG